MKIPHTLYRVNNGDGTTDPISVISFEIGELYNTDILEYCINNYGSKMNPEIKSRIDDVINNTDDFTYDSIIPFVTDFIHEMERIWNIIIKSVIWLADKKAVETLYCHDENGNIEPYKTSDYILSDLGSDGILFAYS